jgi:hypothetical protein
VAMEIADKNMQQYSHTMQLNAILRGKNNQWCPVCFLHFTPVLYIPK